MVKGLLLALLCAHLAAGTAVGAAITFTTVALTGQSAPGTTVDITYSSVGGSTLNAREQVAFLSTLAGPGITSENDIGLWSGAPGSVALLARSGNPAPGTPAGVNFLGGFGSPTLNVAGRSTFLGFLTGGGVTSANDTGFWSGTPRNVALLARKGDAAPGLPAGATYETFSSAHALNAAGQTLFGGSVIGGGVTGSNNTGLWLGAPGNVSLLAREGSPAAGTEAGINYAAFGGMALNVAGQSAFFATLTGGGVTSGNNAGIWSGAPGELAVVARKGDPAPGFAADAGVTYAEVFNQVTINSARQSAFIGLVTGPEITEANNLCSGRVRPAAWRLSRAKAIRRQARPRELIIEASAHPS